MDKQRLQELAGIELTEADKEDETRTVLITASRKVQVYANTDKEAIDAVKDMFKGGDAAAELSDATFKVIGK